ncbi:MAG: filamentous hemagglutinin N-terminal domain-containing protein [Cyanobacteria bacterium P01_B01_bin.77]
MQSRFIGITMIMGIFCHGIAFGQVIPDGTLGSEASTVIQQANRQQIAGGAQRDNILFHSFRDFNVGTTEAIYFANPAGVDAILSRVTGTNPSNILGLLGVEGRADLFFINPQGIMFGPESQLDIAGSFIATTVDSIQLNGYEFSATATSPLPVLTVQVSPGIQYGSSQPEAVIFNQGRLVIGEQQQLILRGGTVQNTGELFAPGGLVKLSGDVIETGGTIITTNATGDSGDITLSALGDLTVGLLDSRSTLGNGGSITVNSQTGSVTTTDNFLSDGNLQAGDITITAAEDIAINGKLLTDSSLTSPEIADFSGVAGDITVIAGGNLDLQAPGEVSRVGDISAAGLQSGAITLTSGGRLTGGNVRIINRLAGDRIGGDIRISAQAMALNETSIGTLTRDESLFFLGIRQDASAGNVIVNVTDDIVLENSLILTNADFTTAKAGDINLTARSLEIRRIPGFNFFFTPESYGIGSISNFNSLGNGGDVNITVTDSVKLIGPVSGPVQPDLDPSAAEFLEFVTQGATIIAGSVGFGDAGTLNLQTGSLTLRDGGGLLTTAIFANGGDIALAVDELNVVGASTILSSTDLAGQDAGNIDIQAGTVTIADGATILTTSRSSGNAGELSLTAERLTIESGAVLASNTRSVGNGSQLTVEVSDQLTISGTNPVGGTPSSISANSLGAGDAGDISISADGFRVLDGATVTVSGEGQGNAGNIDIDTRSLLLDQSAITATSASGEGGNITLIIDDVLVLRQESTISTTAGQTGTGGNGGNITFSNGFIVAVLNENSDITANAFQGNGGNIIITTQGLLGTEFRPQLTPQSDITASSQFGIDGEFIFEQTTPEPDSEIVELPNNFIDAENQIVAGCPADSGATFIVTGRGGLPLDPRQDIEETLIISVLDSSLEPAAHNGEQQRATQAISQLSRLSEQQSNSALIEAQGWQVNETGQVELIATIDQTTTGLASQCIARGNHDT